MKTKTAIVGSLLIATALASGGAWAKPKKKAHPASSVPALATEPEPDSEPTPPATPTPVPVATPAPVPAPAPEAPKKSSIELEALVSEYGAIRDELFRSRAKAAVVGEALMKTQLEVTFRYEAGRAWPLRKVTLRLDDRPVFGADSVANSDAQKVFETVAAAGKHVVTARVEAAGTGEERITYATESSFGIDLADGKLTRVEVDVDETGSGPSQLAKHKEGSFDLRIKANVKQVKR